MVENIRPVIDLRREAPRAPQLRLGGFAVAARVLDKCRAEQAGTNGEFHYNCPVDRAFFAASGLKAVDFSAMVATGADDAAAADWIRREAKSGVVGRSLWNALATIYPGFLLMLLDDWIHAWRAGRRSGG
jgi:Domain of unknown function (DUF5069)